MSVSPEAGKPADPSRLVNTARLVSAYYTEKPDPSVPAERISFGTSGHRGSSLRNTFNENHLLAVTQAICDYRKSQSTSGPLFMGMDTHALSEPAFTSALEVLAANAVEVMIDADGGYTPTPAVSHAILMHNRDAAAARADGIVITPSHNPPEDGGFKYNPPEGGPADTTATAWIADRANALLEADLAGVARMPCRQARKADTTHTYDFVGVYVNDLPSVIDLDLIKSAGLKLGADALGGAGIAYWPRIAEQYGLNMEVLHGDVDPTFRFMTYDWDGKIRMDCSSPHAMAGLIAMKDNYDVAFGSDTDHDRHGIVAPSVGLLNSNHYLAVAIHYLFQHREGWAAQAGIGKTIVSSSMIDRVAASLGRPLVEVPVGFKWFVDGLLDGSLGFGGEESAGASFLRRDGTVWTTDKDGIILGLLAAEMLARTQRDPGQIYQDLVGQFGEPLFERIDTAASPAQKAALKDLKPDDVDAATLAGESIGEVLSHASGNGEPFGGIKVSAPNGWFAARPSGTEDVCKLYAESYKGPDHLKQIQQDAQAILARACGE